MNNVLPFKKPLVHIPASTGSLKTWCGLDTFRVASSYVEAEVTCKECIDGLMEWYYDNVNPDARPLKGTEAMYQFIWIAVITLVGIFLVFKILK